MSKGIFKKYLLLIKVILRKVVLPGFDRLPLYDVLSFFLKGIANGYITTRASALSFNFFLAIFPAIIFFFTLIPYIPVDNFQEELLIMLKDLMPSNAYDATRTILEDIVNNQRGGLLSFGFIAALYFATNGVNAMISAFNNTYFTIETRSWYNQWIIALGLTIMLFLMVQISVLLIIAGGFITDLLVKYTSLTDDVMIFALILLKWLVLFALFFFAISLLYYFGPAKKSRWRFISAGGSLAAILSVITSIGFSTYVNNFGQYNKLYGSIGTLIVILFWLYFNSLALLLGFELNASIGQAGKNKIYKE